jgi:hypothetical protein
LNQERWEKLKTVTWFRAEQDEVTKHVEQLDRYLGAAISALDSILHALADASGFSGKRDDDAELLIEHVRKLHTVAEHAALDLRVGDGNISASLAMALRELQDPRIVKRDVGKNGSRP